MVDFKKVIGSVAYMGGVMSVPEAFCWSWSQLIQFNSEFICKPDEQIWYTKAISSFHSSARNDMVEHMKGDWILMMDTDHRFDPDILFRMLDLIRRCEFDVDVLTGLYQYKHPPYFPTLNTYNKKTHEFQILAKWDDDPEIFEIGSSGAGCLFVKRKVFDRIKKELHEKPFDIVQARGEDISFFYRLEKLGIKAYCAPHIESNHLAVKPISYSDMDLSSFNLDKANTY